MGLYLPHSSRQAHGAIPDLGPIFQRAIIPTGRQKPVLDDDETILIKRYTNANTDPNPNLNSIPNPIPNRGVVATFRNGEPEFLKQ